MKTNTSWITMKEFTIAESERIGIKPESVAERIRRGRYAGLKMRRINSRVVFVDPTQATSKQSQLTK